MRGRFHFFRTILVFMLGAASCFGAEKIEFSAPTQKTDVTPKMRELPNTKENLLESFSRSGPDFSPTLLPQTAVPENKNEERKKKEREKDWIFGKPDEAPSLNELFQAEKSDAKTANTKSNNFLPDLNSNLGSGESTFGDNDLGFSSSKEADLHKSESELRPKWTDGASFSERNLLNANQGSMADLLKNREDTRDRFNAHALNRRDQFEQLLQPRMGEPTLNFIDKTRIPANPTMTTTPPELLGRSGPGAFSQGWQNESLVGGRISSQNDLSPGAVMRGGGSAFDNSQEMRVKTQPTVLPFPDRPGQLFKRPGSF